MTTSSVEERLAQLGFELPQVAAPVAAYVPAVREGNLVHTSGQLPMVDGALAATGKVGAEVTPEQAAELARTCALNALAAVKNVVGSLDVVTRLAAVPPTVNDPGALTLLLATRLHPAARPALERLVARDNALSRPLAGVVQHLALVPTIEESFL